MDTTEYIKTELLILVPVLYFIGIALKKSKIADKWIPALLGYTGIILSAVWVFATSDITSSKEFATAIFTAFTQGILTAGASVYVNQLIVQSKKDK